MASYNYGLYSYAPQCLEELDVPTDGVLISNKLGWKRVPLDPSGSYFWQLFAASNSNQTILILTLEIAVWSVNRWRAVDLCLELCQALDGPGSEPTFEPGGT